MFTQRRPGASIVSTFGVSGSGGRAMLPRDRAVRRRRGFGRFGIGTSRLVGQHRGSLRCELYLRRWTWLASGTSLAIVPAHIAGHIQRGGGTGPLKPRQPFRKRRRERKRCQFL